MTSLSIKSVTFLILIILVSACSDSKRIYEIPNLTKDNLKLCFFGDTGQENPSSQQFIADEMAKEKCDRIYHVGDIVYPKGITSVNDPMLEKKFLRFYEPLTKLDNKPQFSMIQGNHDYEGDPKAWMDVSKKYPWVFAPDLYFMEVYDRKCVIGLDSNLWVHGKHIVEGTKQGAWLYGIKDEIKSRCDLVIALTHHPYKSSGKHRKKHEECDTGLKFFLDSLVIGKANFLFSGHDHLMADYGSIKGTHHIVTGAGGQPEPGFNLGFAYLTIQKLPSGKLKTEVTLNEYDPAHKLLSSKKSTISIP